MKRLEYIGVKNTFKEVHDKLTNIRARFHNTKSETVRRKDVVEVLDELQDTFEKAWETIIEYGEE